jgi:hypothetical protein
MQHKPSRTCRPAAEPESLTVAEYRIVYWWHTNTDRWSCSIRAARRECEWRARLLLGAGGALSRRRLGQLTPHTGTAGGSHA